MTEKELLEYLEEYRKIFINSRINVLKIIIGNLKPGKKIKNYKADILLEVIDELNTLITRSDAFIATLITLSYKTSITDTEAIIEEFKKKVIYAVDNRTIHNEALDILVNTMSNDVRSGVGVVYKNITTLVDKIVIDNVGESLSASSIKLAKEMIKEDLISNSIFSITYKNGRKVSLESYADMCARSITREATNKAMANVLTENNFDLVRITTHSPTCEICSVYQGRVYSINPKRTDYPYLYDTAFKSGYNNLHPNCRHVIVPYIDNLYDKSKVEKDKEESNKDFVVSNEYLEKENQAYKKMVKKKRDAYRKRIEKQKKKEEDIIN